MKYRRKAKVVGCWISRVADTSNSDQMSKFELRTHHPLPQATALVFIVFSLLYPSCLLYAQQPPNQQRQIVPVEQHANNWIQKHVTNHLISNSPLKAHLATEQSMDYAAASTTNSSSFDRNSFKFIQAIQKGSREKRENKLQDSSPLNLQQPLTRLNGLNLTPGRTQTRTVQQQEQVIGLTEAGGSESTKTDPKVFKQGSEGAQAQTQKTPAGAKQKLVRLETTASQGDDVGHVRRQTRVARQVTTGMASEVLQVEALLGQRLAIPCNHTAAPITASPTRHQLAGSKQNRVRLRPNGQGISLLTWHKDSQLDMPVFVADARGVAALREARQQTNAEWLRGRAHLEESTHLDARGQGSTPALVIDEATSSDAGIYTCTVDFHKAQTQTHQVNVSLIDPPSDMIIRDELSRTRIEANLVGPFDEDAQLSLSCELGSSGQPNAQVTWWRFESVASLSDTRWPTAPAEQAQLVAGNQQANYLGTLARLNDQPWREYFVAFLPSSTVSLSKEGVGPQAARQLQQLALPFDDGRQLRLWSKVKSFAAGSANELAEPTSGSDQSPQTSSGKLRLTLSRSNLGDQYLCLAQNSHLVAPLNFSIQINMNLRPLEVKIVNKSAYTFKLGQKITIECQVHGSKPSALVRWFKSDGSRQDRELKPNGDIVSETNRDIDNDLTKVSYLTIVPELSDNQQILTCSGSNPQMNRLSPLTDSLVMNVLFPAQLNLRFGSEIRLESINVGGDVFMDCNVQANPAIHDLSWSFNDKPLTEDANKGIKMSNHSLVIHGIKIEHRGHYQCVAENALGRSASNKLILRPRFAPVCDTQRTRARYEVPVGQQVRIDCFVLAEPSDDLQFRWQLNKTLGDQPRDTQLVEELREGFTTNFTQSHLNFKLRSRRHQAQLLCSASNSMGHQEQPCVIQVVASEAPDPVISCFFDDFTSTSFSIHCQAPGSVLSSGQLQGQQKQTYLLELQPINSIESRQTASNSNPIVSQQLRDAPDPLDPGEVDAESSTAEQQHYQQHETEKRVRKLSSELPSFHVTDLRPNTNYLVRVYAQNSRGRSNPLSYERSTLSGPPDQSDSGETEPGSSAASMQFHAPGQVQLINKLRHVDGSSLSTRLISFLNVGQYIGAGELNSAKPVLSIALIVLLCTISLVTVVFFANRLCKSAGAARQGSASSDRKQKRASLLKQVQHVGSAADLRTYDKRDPQLLKLTPACHVGAAAAEQQQRSNGGIGSGSDTSRETNTDSTLILSSPLTAAVGPTTSSSSSANNNSKSQVAPPGHKRTISVVRFSGSPCLHQNEYADARPLCCLGGERASLMGSSPLESANHEDSQTPQVSIQSGSDCTTSRNDSETFRPSLIGRVNDNLAESIYMIGSSDKYAAAGEQTLHLLNTESLDADGNCNLLASCQRESPLAQASHFGFLPSSMSIPLALSGHQDQQHQQQIVRNISQELLCNATDLCLQAGSYLTLGPAGRLSRVHDDYDPASSSGCCAHSSYNMADLHWPLAIPAPFSPQLATTCAPDAHSYGSWSGRARRQSVRARLGRASVDLAATSRCCNNEPTEDQSHINSKPQHAPLTVAPDLDSKSQRSNDKSSHSYSSE